MKAARLPLAALWLILLLRVPGPAGAQTGASIGGRVTELSTGRPVAGVTISVEGLSIQARTDTGGHYVLRTVPPGPQVLDARRIGFAVARVALTVPPDGSIVRDIQMAATALRMRDVQVTADPVGRARGELGTATVVNRQAIANQSATSLAGVLELVPGIPLTAPGLDNVQQVALRAVPTMNGTAERAGAFGTLIILDGVPLSNNTNLQTTGPRGEIIPKTSAGGGIDLRQIPAAALERVEVIRGVPSARYGDLTQGAIVIDTRAGVVAPEVVARYDPRTVEASVAGGMALAGSQQASITGDLARTQLSPGVGNADVWRANAQFAHRLSLGRVAADRAGSSGMVLDTRINLHQVYQNTPEQPAIAPGVFSTDRSGGLRLSERGRAGPTGGRHVEITASVEEEWQRTRAQALASRPAQPFTDATTPGRNVGHFVAGTYPALITLNGAPWHVYVRAEGVLPGGAFGADNTIRLGTELRREWNAGAGYDFDIEFPPQSQFNGVNGFDRPRRYDAIAPMATSAFYVDDRFMRALPAGMSLDLQAGLRTDALHAGSWWASSLRDAVVQPRVNAQLGLRPWLRLRGAWGRTAKVPSAADLYPAPQYYDLVNVNWYPPDSAERLAVLTTFIKDPTNPRLGFAVAHAAEAGVEIDLGRSGAALTLVGFHEVTTGGVAYTPDPSFLLREHFALTDSSTGTGRPPGYVTPAQSIDTVPIFIDRPENIDRTDSRGIEWTLSLPEIAAIRTRAELSGAWVKSKLSNDAMDLGQTPRIDEFQLDSTKARTPYWLGVVDRGERALATGRVIHHQADLGLVITGTIQYFITERRVQEGATDTLAWAGYVTRAGSVVPVPREQRGDPQYADLRQRRLTLLTSPNSPAPDWLLSLQVAKAILGEGRLSMYAFNALNRMGKPASDLRGARYFPPVRFGVDVTIPTAIFQR